jgi:hypothetical protein
VCEIDFTDSKNIDMKRCINILNIQIVVLSIIYDFYTRSWLLSDHLIDSMEQSAFSETQVVKKFLEEFCLLGYNAVKSNES